MCIDESDSELTPKKLYIMMARKHSKSNKTTFADFDIYSTDIENNGTADYKSTGLNSSSSDSFVKLIKVNLTQINF